MDKRETLMHAVFCLLEHLAIFTVIWCIVDLDKQFHTCFTPYIFPKSPHPKLLDHTYNKAGESTPLIRHYIEVICQTRCCCSMVKYTCSGKELAYTNILLQYTLSFQFKLFIIEVEREKGFHALGSNPRTVDTYFLSLSKFPDIGEGYPCS